MGRIHAPEIEDEPWFPTPLRDALTAFLQVITERMGTFSAAGPVLNAVLARHRQERVVDLCSGGGGALLSLMEQLPASTRATLTDLYPNQVAFAYAEARSNRRIEGRRASVDATDVPAELGGVRTLFNSFHHFRPPMARKILEDAARKHQPICVFEIVERRFLTMLAIFFVPVAVWATAPFQPGFNLFRFVFTYLVPLVPLFAWWDGLCSCLRGYSPAELAALTADIDVKGYDFSVSQSRGVFLRVTALVGEPTSLDPQGK